MNGTKGLPAAIPLVVIVMGVSGAGKSAVAEAMNAQLRWPYQEGDALHPPANIQKMHAGIPLTDEDRVPWLNAVRTWIEARLAAGEPGLVTCSALKRTYRERLAAGGSLVRPLYLVVDRAVLEARLAQRTGHFMPPSLLDSQLATLEPPGPDENAMVVSGNGTLQETVNLALDAVRSTSEGGTPSPQT